MDSPTKSTVRRRRADQVDSGVHTAAEPPLDVPTPSPTTLLSMNATLSDAKVASATTPSAAPGVPEGARTAGPQPNILFFVYASMAGIFGALSGVVGKVAVAEDAVSHVIAFLCGTAGVAAPSTDSLLITVLPLVLRGLFFAANAFFTAQMWRYYLKSLSLGPTPVCQIVNTGTNFTVSALCGILFFSESVNGTWAVGAFLVVLGLGLVVTDPAVGAS